MNTRNRYFSRFTLGFIIFIVFSLGFVSLTSADTPSTQDDCPVLVKSALDATAQLCTGMNQDQACYGHILLDATPYAGFGPLSFSEPGDITDVFALRSLRLSAMNVESGTWGLARMDLRTNTPVATSDKVTVLMFGDVKVDNAVTPSTTLDATVSVSSYVNVRLWPSTESGVLGTLAPRQTVNAISRLADSSWVRVELPDTGTFGWLSASVTAVDGDISTLPVEAPSSPHYGPMKAFYFQDYGTGNQVPGCTNAPASGILIQTPEGAGEISFLINEVDIRIGSTVFLQGEANGNMTISTVEGGARVRTHGSEQIAVAGSQVTVPLNENLEPVGPPTAPQPYDATVWDTLPLAGLGNPVAILPPASPAQIQERVAAKNGIPFNNPGDCSNGNSCNAPGNPGTECHGNDCVTGSDNAANPVCPANSCDAGNKNNPCPGRSCDAAGGSSNAASGGGGSSNAASGSCHGNSCNNPGQGN